MRPKKSPSLKGNPNTLCFNNTPAKGFSRWPVLVGLILTVVFLFLHYHRQWGMPPLFPGEYTTESAVVVVPDPQSFFLDSHPDRKTETLARLAEQMVTRENATRVYRAYRAEVKKQQAGHAHVSAAPHDSKNKAVFEGKVLEPSQYTLSYVPDDENYTLKIRVQGNDPAAIRALANVAAQTVLNVYEDGLKSDPDKASSPLSGLEARMGNYLAEKRLEDQDKLAQVSKEIETLQSGGGSGGNTTSLQSYQWSSAMGNLENLLEEAKVDHQSILTARKTLLEQLGFSSLEEARISETFSSDPVLKALRRELFQSKLKCKTLLSESQGTANGEESPEVQTLQNYVDYLQKNWQSRVLSLMKQPGGNSEKTVHSVQEAGVDLPALAQTGGPHVRWITPPEMQRVYQLAAVSGDLDGQMAKIRTIQRQIRKFRSSQVSIRESGSDRLQLLTKEARQLENELTFLDSLAESLRNPEGESSEMTRSFAKIKYLARSVERNNFQPAWLMGLALLLLVGRLIGPATPWFEGNPPGGASEDWETPELKVNDYIRSSRVMNLKEQPGVKLPFDGANGMSRNSEIHIPMTALKTPAMDETSLLRAVNNPLVLNAFVQMEETLVQQGMPKVVGVCQNPCLATGLALALAKRYQPVVLLDASLAAPRIDTIFGVQGQAGVLSLFSNPKSLETILNQAASNNPLVILPAGTTYQADQQLNTEEYCLGMSVLTQGAARVIVNLPPFSDLELFERMFTLSGCEGLLIGLLEGAPPGMNRKILTHLKLSPLPVDWLHVVSWMRGEKDTAPGGARRHRYKINLPGT